MTGLKIERWNIEEMTGYKPLTTFYEDFSIADMFGIDAIKDTYKRGFIMAKAVGYQYLTELSMVLNHKIWRWYEVDYTKAKVYDKLWKEIDEYCCQELEGDELNYYFRTTD